MESPRPDHLLATRRLEGRQGSRRELAKLQAAFASKPWHLATACRARAIHSASIPAILSSRRDCATFFAGPAGTGWLFHLRPGTGLRSRPERETVPWFR